MVVFFLDPHILVLFLSIFPLINEQKHISPFQSNSNPIHWALWSAFVISPILAVSRSLELGGIAVLFALEFFLFFFKGFTGFVSCAGESYFSAF